MGKDGRPLFLSRKKVAPKTGSGGGPFLFLKKIYHLPVLYCSMQIGATRHPISFVRWFANKKIRWLTPMQTVRDRLDKTLSEALQQCHLDGSIPTPPSATPSVALQVWILLVIFVLSCFSTYPYTSSVSYNTPLTARACAIRPAAISARVSPTPSRHDSTPSDRPLMT